MPLFQLVLLALIQGVTEFLPISSSGHLLLFPALSGVADQGLSLDVAVHLGTLGAVVLFFRADVAAVLRGVAALPRRPREPEARLALMLAAATLPLILAGAAVAATGLDGSLRSVEVVAWTTIVWGLALWLADKLRPERRRFHDWRWRDAVAMGLAQALAIAPGTSRSGITITCARALGYARVDAARLSMLMSAPALTAAGGWLALDLARAESLELGLDAAIAAALAFVSALAALAVLMRMLRTWSMTPFVVYRLVLGAALLWVAYG